MTERPERNKHVFIVIFVVANLLFLLTTKLNKKITFQFNFTLKNENDNELRKIIGMT